MKLSILVILTALFIFFSAFQNPALFFIGYLWASVLYPTAFAATLFPLSMIFGLFCLIGYFFIDKTNSGKFPVVFYLLLAFAAWVTITTITATLPGLAWVKWDWAIQSVLIAAAAPVFLRTRAQIEGAFAITLSAFSAHVLTAGIKTLFGTGGYDRLGTLMPGNSWLAETSTLALAAVITIPMAYYLIRQSIILERYRGRALQAAFAVYTILAMLCVIGTSARTGLLAFAVLAVFVFRSTFRKPLVFFGAGACIAVGLLAVPYIVPEKSLVRFNTINTYQQDDSAETRIGVWNWTWKYSVEHPLGGGFGIFAISIFNVNVRQADGQITTRQAVHRAPHSVYFEVLGEQGYPGLIMYFAMIVSALWGAYKIFRWNRSVELEEWWIPFSRTLFVCISVFCTGGAFLGIAFDPILYIFLGFYCSVYRLTLGRKSRTSVFSVERDPYAASVR